MKGKREGINRRNAILGAAAAGADLTLAHRKGAAQSESGAQPERTESPGEMDMRLLNEYARYLKTQSKVFSNGTVPDIIRLLAGIPQIWDPEQYEANDRKLIYGPFSQFLEAKQSKNLPVIPFKNSARGIFWNLTRSGEREALSSARMEYAATGKQEALGAMKQGVDVVLRKMASFGEYESVPALPLTEQKDSDLHSTRATIVGLAYTHKEAQDKGERQPVFVSGVILSQSGADALSSAVAEAYATKGRDESQKEILRAIAKGAMIFDPALGHESVSVLGRSDSSVGAPLVNGKGELVGILSDAVELSYEEKQGRVGKRVFLIQGPDNIRRAQKMHR